MGAAGFLPSHPLVLFRQKNQQLLVNDQVSRRQSADDFGKLIQTLKQCNTGNCKV